MAEQYATDYTIDELMVAVIARDLRDGEVGFIGLGTSGRAFQLAVGMPLAASALARLTTAPKFNIFLGPMLNPREDRIPANLLKSSTEVLEWECEARVPVPEVFDFVFRSGRLGVGFVSGAQIDQHGNLNIVSIGDYDRPKVRLVGPLLQTEHMAFANRNIIPVDVHERTFVPHVDFISGVGQVAAGKTRKEIGLPGGGPSLVVTDMAIFDFHPETGRMRLKSVHPGVSIDDVRNKVGFDLDADAGVPETEPPTQEQVTLLRKVIDPHHALMRHL